MLGPPNQGAQMAEALAASRMFHFVAGASASQLGRDWDASRGEAGHAGIPVRHPGRRPRHGQGLQSLAGERQRHGRERRNARDWPARPISPCCRCVHTLMMDDPKVQQYTLRFFKHGYFVSARRAPSARAGRTRAGVSRMAIPPSGLVSYSQSAVACESSAGKNRGHRFRHGAHRHRDFRRPRSRSPAPTKRTAPRRSRPIGSDSSGWSKRSKSRDLSSACRCIWTAAKAPSRSKPAALAQWLAEVDRACG